MDGGETLASAATFLKFVAPALVVGLFTTMRARGGLPLRRIAWIASQAILSDMIGDIREQLAAAPFEPFTVVTTSGRRYPVPSADHAGLNPRGSRVVVWFDDDSSVTIAGLHIAAIEKGLAFGGENGN